MKSQNIVHITHTDIHYDSRIIKSMDAISDLTGGQVFGIGLTENEKDPRKTLTKQNYCLKSRLVFKILPRPIRLMMLGPIIIFIEYILVSIYQLMKRKPRLIHAHDYLALAPSYIYAKIFGCLLVYDAHELESKKNGSTKAESFLIRALESAAWKKIDGLVTVSQAIEKWYEIKYGPKKSCVTLNSPLIALDDSHATKSFRDTFSIPKEKIVAVYVGLFVKGRGIENILKIAKETADIYYVFLGGGELEENIRREVEKTENIMIHSFVKHSEVVSYLRSADIGLCLLENVSLSDYYAIPNKLLEYAFSGLYVVGSDFPEMKKVIDDYSLGVCLPEGLDDAIKTLSSIRRENVDQRKRKPLSDLYDLSWARQADNLRELYKDLLG